MSKVDQYIEKYLGNRYKNVKRKTNVNYIRNIPEINYKYSIGIDVNKAKSDFNRRSIDILDQLSKIAYFSSGISKYEILNRYKVHTFNPTARNLHSPLMHIFIDNKSLRYNYLKNKFEVFKIEDNKLFNFKDKFYIVCYSELFPLTSYYGEFGYFLAGLDAGHLLHNIKLILALEDLNAKLIYGYNHREICELINRSHLEVRPFFILEIDKNLESRVLQNYFKDNSNYLNSNKVYKFYFEMMQYQGLCEVLNSYEYEHDNALVKEDLERYNYLDKDKMVDTLIRRSSAHNLVGNICYQKSQCNDALIDVFKKLIDYKTKLANHKYFKCYLVQNHAHNRIKIIDEKMVEKTIYDDIEKVNFNIIHDSYEYFQTHTFSGHIILTADINGIKNDLGLTDLYLDYSILTSGDLMQAVSLITSELGYFCRPIKNYKDDYLKKILNEEKEIMYTAAIGESNNSNTLIYNL